MNVIGIIPARYESSRFPGKPLAKILGESMIQRVYEQCLKSSMLSEIIVATDASIEGDATGLYLSELLKDYPIKLTRLARGLPIGGTLEHVDQTTLSRSIEDRVELK